MPVVAVIAGIASAAAGAAGAAALIGGTITLSTVAAGLAVVGGVATALGAVTGNKKLMKFGMITGLAGAAVGGIASLSSAASQSATTLATGDSGLGLSAKAAGEGLQAADTGLIGIGSKASEVAGGGAFSQGLDQSLGAVNAIDTGVSSLSRVAAPVAAPAAAPTASYGLQAPSVAQAPQNNFSMASGNTMADAAQQLAAPTADTGTSAFGNFGQWLDKNKEMAKVGTGILSGVGQGYMAQQQQRDAERAAAEQRVRINASISGQRQAY